MPDCILYYAQTVPIIFFTNENSRQACGSTPKTDVYN